MNNLDHEAVDADLVARAIAGEERAFTLLMRRHKDALYRFALRYTNDAELAYDVLQQALISAWQALSRYDSSRPLEAWLRTIIRNKCRDARRKAKVRRWINLSLVTPTGAEYDAPGYEPDPERITSVRGDLENVKTAISALPDGLKTPLILTAFEGLSMAETAEQLGLTEKAVENRLYRARKRLRTIISGA